MFRLRYILYTSLLSLGLILAFNLSVFPNFFSKNNDEEKFLKLLDNEFAKSMRMTKEEALEALKAFEQFGAAARISLTKVFGNEATFNMLASL